MWWLLLLACGGSDPKAVDSASTSDTGICWVTSPADCAGADCSTILGREVRDDAGQPCVDFGTDPTPLGCMPSGGGCLAVETLAAPPDDPDTCWWFGGCLPEGWVVCSDFETWEECP